MKTPVKRLGRRSTDVAGPAAGDLAKIALELFADRHFTSVTIKDIGRAANVSSAMIYYHFKDKNALFNAAISSAIDDALQLFADHCDKDLHDSAMSATNAWIEVRVALQERLGNVFKISRDCRGQEFAEARKAVRRYYRQESKLLQEIIRTGIASGEFRGVEPSVAATMISCFFDGVLPRVDMLKEFDLPKAVEEFKRTLCLRLGYRPLLATVSPRGISIIRKLA